MTTHKGIMLDTGFGLLVIPKRKGGLITSGLAVGDTIDQDAALVLKLSQGELKEDPMIGAGLSRFTRGKYDESQINNRIRQHLNRAGIDYDNYKERMATAIKTTE